MAYTNPEKAHEETWIRARHSKLKLVSIHFIPFELTNVENVEIRVLPKAPLLSCLVLKGLIRIPQKQKKPERKANWKKLWTCQWTHGTHQKKKTRTKLRPKTTYPSINT